MRVEKYRPLGLNFIKVVLLTIEALALLKYLKQEDLRSHRPKKTPSQGCWLQGLEDLREKQVCYHVHLLGFS